LPPLQRALLAKFAEPWLQADGQSCSCMASLLALHHYVHQKELQNLFCQWPGNAAYPDGGALAMYADTSDSMFSKGACAGQKKGQPLLDFDRTQASGIHLARPQGGLECEISRESIQNDGAKLGAELLQWMADNPSQWDEATLLAKRTELQDILRRHCAGHMAETRIPNNDVSLWQHSSSTASIFKALLASRLLSGSWDGLLEKGELAHAKQSLAMLAVQWDDEAFLAKSMRSFEIVGRRARLFTLAKAIKKTIETELCIGNEVYSDHRGICFLVPDLAREGASEAEQQCLDAVRSAVDRLCNGEIVKGDLPWKIRLESCGLRLTGMLALWKEPFASQKAVVATGPAQPLWMQDWTGKAGSQICPRCGLRPIPWTASRTGGSADKACCAACEAYRQGGAAIIDALRKGRDSDYASQSFGDIRIEDDGRFWSIVEPDEGEPESGDNRICLVQGSIPLDTLYDGSFFNALLSPPAAGKTWRDLHATAAKACDAILAGKESGETHQALAPLLGESFGGERDGWSSNAKDGRYQLAWLKNMVLDDPSLAGLPPARAAVVWAARQHPSPSRLARMIAQLQEFMRSAFTLAERVNIPFAPLTCDAGIFQMLVPASRALGFARSVAARYSKDFGRVRHLLPLHLSCAVFYRKSPLYIAMDAARRFRQVPDAPEAWLLEGRSEAGGAVRLSWRLPDGRRAEWDVPSELPGGGADLWHTWLQPEDPEAYPDALRNARPGQKYMVRPSTFDFEVLDASTRRYDIRYPDGGGRRPHFMMPKTPDGPRPYPLETLEAWASLEPFFTDEGTQSQRKTAFELLARLHADWRAAESAFKPMAADILAVTMGPEAALNAQLLDAAMDGTIFDLYEWHDFLEN
ncbi:MAG: hypothetical protein K6E40_00815, partial [Desulfovibrio sp.]|nr:hypothetical protein [Desulfovibrio sp.]